MNIKRLNEIILNKISQVSIWLLYSCLYVVIHLFTKICIRRKSTHCYDIIIIKDDNIGDIIVTLPIFLALRSLLPPTTRLAIFTSPIMAPSVRATGIFDAVIPCSVNYRCLTFRDICFFSHFRAKVCIDLKLQSDIKRSFLGSCILAQHHHKFNSCAKFIHENRIRLKREKCHSFTGYLHYLSDIIFRSTCTIGFHWPYEFLVHDKSIVQQQTVALAKMLSLDCSALEDAVRETFEKKCLADLYKKSTAIAGATLDQETEESYQTGNYVLLIPGASNPKRCWPSERFIYVLKKIIANDPTIKILITGAKGEETLCNTIADALGKHAVNLCGKITILHFIKLALNCRYAFGNETGTTNITSTLAVDTFCLVGGGHFNLFCPCSYRPSLIPIYHLLPCFSCSWWPGNIDERCKNAKTYMCIDAISVEDALAAIRSHYPALQHGQMDKKKPDFT